MTRNTLIRSLTVLLVLCCTARVATAATVTIDDFNDSTASPVLNLRVGGALSGYPTSEDETEAGINVIGNVRETYLSITAPQDTSEVRLLIDPRSGYHYLATSTFLNDDVTVVLRYDADASGTTGFAGSGIDLTDSGTNNGIGIEITADQGITIDAILETLGGNGSHVPPVMTAGGTEFIYLPFSAFSGGVDATQVKAIEFQFFAVGGADYTIRFIGAIPEPQLSSVPEPSGWWLGLAFAVAVLGYAAGWRRR